MSGLADEIRIGGSPLRWDGCSPTARRSSKGCGDARCDDRVLLESSQDDPRCEDRQIDRRTQGCAVVAAAGRHDAVGLRCRALAARACRSAGTKHRFASPAEGPLTKRIFTGQLRWRCW